MSKQTLYEVDGKMAAVTHESVKKVRDYIRELSADEEARRLAFVRERALRDEASQLRYAREQGLKQGEVKGEAKLLKLLIIKRFDQFPVWAQDKLNAADSVQLEAWADRTFTADTLEDLLA